MKRKADETTADAGVQVEPTTEPVDNASSEVQVDYTTGSNDSNSSSPEEAPRPRRLRYDTVKVPVPSDKYDALRGHWLEIYVPLVERMKLMVHFNVRTHNVELRVGPETPNLYSLIRGADFVKAFTYGFKIKDALELLQLDDLIIRTFEIPHVTMLSGEPLLSVFGFLSDTENTKLIVEKITKSRIVLLHNKIHILGCHKNIKRARRAIRNLILP
ncbi:PREDICTED: RNA-binding protein pno1-like [Drosophila arizonae]|uniref:RNA-binding protein pno1-like n=1 Tax=Drosophila arizonae TaxID=7263 RepID=A0ABM1PQF6_DROAR|nr:PREDICTED: RNA-binding protein pno1-like [Drosophila arizonae]